MRHQRPAAAASSTTAPSGHVPRLGLAAYTATKHAITGLTRATALDGRAHDIACGQIDVGNAATEMTEGMAAGALQADGSVRPEPRIDVADVARAVCYMASLPLDANGHDGDGDQDALRRPRLAPMGERLDRLPHGRVGGQRPSPSVRRRTSRTWPMSRAMTSCTSSCSRSPPSRQHAGRGYVDVRDGLGVEHHRPIPGSAARARMTSRTASALAKNSPLSRRRTTISGAPVLRVAEDVAVVADGPTWPSTAMRARGPVEQQQQRHRDADEQPGEGVEDQHAQQRGQRGQEVGPGGDAVDAAELAGGDPVEGDQARDVDQLDHGRDHHRGQGRLGRVSNSSVRNSRVRTVRAATTSPDTWERPRRAVHGGLGQAGVTTMLLDSPAPRWPRPARAAPGWRRSRSGAGRHRSWPRRAPRRSRPASP